MKIPEKKKKRTAVTKHRGIEEEEVFKNFGMENAENKTFRGGPVSFQMLPQGF